jgi:hypothetical protein
VIPLLCTLTCLLLLSAVVIAENASPQRTYNASKAEVEKALRDMRASAGGRLPTLEGFAVPSEHSLDQYKRGYYLYSLQLKTSQTGHTTVAVHAKITAWYSDTASSKSGYQVLKSSGRLEDDLLDSLDEVLARHAAANTSGIYFPAHRAPYVSNKTLPDSPSTSAAPSIFSTPRLPTSPSNVAASAGKSNDPATERRVQELRQQADSLKTILQNQSRPSDLAVVKSSHTPVLAQPVDGARSLLLADPEDEFQVLDSTDTWVHVQISGISRGWIQRNQVDIPGAAKVSLSALNSERQDRDAFRETKEEVALFPGKWAPLDGKRVKIIWVQPLETDDFGSEPRWTLAKSVFRKADSDDAKDLAEVAGVVVVFDSQDGGMAAVPMPTLQQWRAGHLPDDVFLKRCWLDPAEAFKTTN